MLWCFIFGPSVFCAIGNYGNKLDDNTPAQSSTTPPTNPVYDGNKYFFLPWMDQKPCVSVDSQWEDCSYRIESLNILLFTADQLVSVDYIITMSWVLPW